MEKKGGRVGQTEVKMTSASAGRDFNTAHDNSRLCNSHEIYIAFDCSLKQIARRIKFNLV